MFSRVFLTCTFLIIANSSSVHTANETEEVTGRLLSIIEKVFSNNVVDFVEYLTKRLEAFNDERFGKSTIGRMVHYQEIKPQLNVGSGRSRMKKASMALLPLVFHVGASSTWMLLTSIMAAKSVAIGLVLLVFKIAVSSAKVASFFTKLNDKHHEHHGWTSHDHHTEHHVEHPPEDLSYSPEGPPNIYSDYTDHYKSDHHHDHSEKYHHDNDHSEKFHDHVYPQKYENYHEYFTATAIYKNSDQYLRQSDNEIEDAGNYQGPYANYGDKKSFERKV